MRSPGNGPGNRPISEDEIMQMIFSAWGVKLGAFVSVVFITWIFCTMILGFGS